GSGEFNVTTPSPVSTVGWHQVVGILNGKTITLEIDGVPTGKEFAQSVFPTVASKAANRIGNYGSTGYLDAEVDQFSLYNRALTPTEVAQHDALVGFRLQSKNSEKCIDVRNESANNGAAIQQWTCRALPAYNQVFYLIPAGLPFYQ